MKVDYLDAFLLHISFEDESDNLIAWRVFETFVPDKIRILGVSNFTLPQLQTLYNFATIKPKIVQNKFFQETSYDLDLRFFCQHHDICYQAYWMLKHNPEILESDLLAAVATRLDVAKELALYLLVLGLGDISILDGTTNAEHMSQDCKSVSEIYNDEKLLAQLQPAVADFKRLLWKLAGPEERLKPVKRKDSGSSDQVKTELNQGTASGGDEWVEEEPSGGFGNLKALLSCPSRLWRAGRHLVARNK